MKARSSLGASAPGTSQRLGTSLIAPIQFETAMAAYLRVFERIGSINRIWLDAAQEANNTASDLATRLVRCGNAAEGAGLCNEWVQERASRFASDSQKAAELWMGLYGSAIAGPDEAADPHRKDENPGAGHERHPSSKAA